MLNSLRVPVLLAALAVAGCGASFDVEVKSQSTIKSGGLFGGLVSNAFGDFSSIDLSESGEFKNAGVAKEDVDSVKIKTFTLSIVTPADGTFEFLDKISFFIETAGQPKVLIARKDAIANDAKTVTLDVSDVELAPYVTAPKMSITTEATAHAPSSDTRIEAVIVFDVDPRLL